jgi:hypothetical protein
MSKPPISAPRLIGLEYPGGNAERFIKAKREAAALASSRVAESFGNMGARYRRAKAERGMKEESKEAAALASAPVSVLPAWLSAYTNYNSKSAAEKAANAVAAHEAAEKRRAEEYERRYRELPGVDLAARRATMEKKEEERLAAFAAREAKVKAQREAYELAERRKSNAAKERIAEAAAAAERERQRRALLAKVPSFGSAKLGNIMKNSGKVHQRQYAKLLLSEALNNFEVNAYTPDELIEAIDILTLEDLINVDKPTGNTPLIKACIKGLGYAALKLIEKGVSVDNINKAGFDARHYAVENKLVSVVKAIDTKLASGVNADGWSVAVPVPSVPHRLPSLSAKRRGGYRATRRDKKYLKLYKQGKSIGFTMRASLKAKGLIPRANGTRRVSKKYK